MYFGDRGDVCRSDPNAVSSEIGGNGRTAPTGVCGPAKVETRDGERLQGVHIAPARTTSGDRLVILGFGGNAWNAETLAAYLHELFPDMDVVIFGYPGCWPSTGLPSATAFGGKAALSGFGILGP